jgi:predicted phage tail protein
VEEAHEGRNIDESRFSSNTRRRRRGPWLRALAGTCLAVALTGGPVLATGGVAAGAPARILAHAPNGPSSPQSARAAAPRFCLTAVAGDSQVQLRWFPSAPGEDLAIHYATVQDVKAGQVSVTTSALVDKLKNGFTYEFWLADGEDPAAVSNMVLVIPSAKPTVPTWFCLAAVAGDTQVHLKWFPAAPGDGFTIYGGTEPDSNTAVRIRGATGTSALVDELPDGSALVNGTTYSFWLVGQDVGPQAADDTRLNLVSNMASATPAAKPGAPAGLTATPGDSQVTLSWAAPASDGGAPVSGYDVYRGTSPGGETGAPVGGSPVSATSTTVTGLANGTTYYFNVAAVNGAGEGPASAEVSAVPVTRPDPPTGLTATPGDSQVTLSWAAPASDGGAPVSGYDVYRGTSPGGETGAPVGGSPVSATSTIVTGLDNGTTYYFTVAAVNGVGEGPVSAEVSATPAATPGAPIRLTATAGNAQVTLSWTAPASDGGLPVTGYHLYAGTTADFSGQSSIVTVTGTVVTVTGLANGTTYYFKVAAVSRAGEGPGTVAEAVPLTTPGAPAALTATPGDSQATLSWAAPASDGGAPISEYIIYQGTSPGGETGAPVSGSPVTATSTTVTGLVNGTTYYFKVAAVNAAGQSPLSAEASAASLSITVSSPSPSGTATQSSATTPSSTGSESASTPAPEFAAPTGLTATAGNTQVHLSWAAPPPDGGPPVSDYVIYYATTPRMQPVKSLGPTRATDGSVTGLVNGTVYYFKLTAVNAAGNESPASTEVSAEPTGPVLGVTVSLNSPTVPNHLIALLTAVAALAAAAVFTLIARRRRRLRSRDPDSSARGRARSGQQMAAPSDVRAEPDAARPDMVSVRDTGREPTQTVRLEPHPGAATTTIKEGRP